MTFMLVGTLAGTLAAWWLGRRIHGHYYPSEEAG